MFWFGHYTPSVVLTAVEFRERYRLSSNEIEQIFKDHFQLTVPNSTVCDWVNRLAGRLTELRQAFKPDFSNLWHVDEIFVKHIVKIDGGKHRFFDYLWVVYDDKLNVVATHVSEKRDYENAKLVLQKAKSFAGFSPRILVSDGLQAYLKACSDVFGRKTLHHVGHFQADQFFWDGRFWLLSNNKAEHGNTFFRAFLRSLKGYKTIQCGRRLLELFSWFFNVRKANGLAAAMLGALVPRL
ncbi:MAG: DDE-type integrase/transposase/recombinase [Candidatus Micrarchaeota archaeon]